MTLAALVQIMMAVQAVDSGCARPQYRACCGSSRGGCYCCTMARPPGIGRQYGIWVEQRGKRVCSPPFAFIVV